MKIGMLLRNSGPISTPSFIADCARAGDESELDSLWVLDHVAIPPDDAEGSGGRYVDALATLAYVAGITARINIGTSVLVLPYRPPLATANWIAAIQELSAGRLMLGVGAGWMETEFVVSNADRGSRGRVTDETLAFMHECFGNDVVTRHGKPFIFSPRPQCPPILVGGTGPHVARRIVAFGDGWMPTSGDADKLQPEIRNLARAMREAGKPAPSVIPLTQLELDDVGKAADQISALAEAGCTEIEHAARYESVAEFRSIADLLLTARQRAGAG